MKVVLTSAVQHDGKDMVEGDTLDLPEAQAEGLIAAGAAVTLGRKSKTEAQAAAKAEAEAQAQADAAAAEAKLAAEAAGA